MKSVELSNERGLPKSAGLTAKEGEFDPRDYQIGIVTGGTYNVFAANEPLAWAVTPIPPNSVVFVDLIPNMVVELSDALAYLAGLFEVALPTPHEAMDSFRHIGYDLIRTINGPNSF